MFISEAEIFVQQWLINHTNEMFGESEDGQRGYDKLSKPKVEMVFVDIKKSVIYASKEVEGKHGNIIYLNILRTSFSTSPGKHSSIFLNKTKRENLLLTYAVNTA
jgi:hypothetical protein